MAFQQGLSGLNAAAKALDVTSNNIANASTIGFKGANAHFGDIFAASLGISGASKVGIGANVATVAQQFTQGNIKTTSNPLDVAINGTGFFQIQQGQEKVYSRNGQFHVDDENYIVNDAGGKLLVYKKNETSGDFGDYPESITIPDNKDSIKQETAKADVGINLDSTALNKSWDTITVSDVNTAPIAADVDTYNYSRALTIYDAKGAPHSLTMYFVKGVDAGKWDVHFQVDGTSEANVNEGTPITLEFDAYGKQLSPSSDADLPVLTIKLGQVATELGDANNTNLPDLTFPIDFNMTEYGDSFVDGTITQDGYGLGYFSSVSIGPDGVVQANYNNGQARDLGKVALFSFKNPNGLVAIGNNAWRETVASGERLRVGDGNFVLQSGALEESNVDLTAELVDMIVQQRNYQANAQSIKTQDALLQTMVNLR